MDFGALRERGYVLSNDGTTFCVMSAETSTIAKPEGLTRLLKEQREYDRIDVPLDDLF